MSEKVVAMPGFSLPLMGAEPNDKLVAMLERLLRDAKGGRLVGIAYASVLRDPPGIGSAWTQPGGYIHPLMASVALLEHRIATQLTSEMEG